MPAPAAHPTVVIRPGHPGDAPALRRLAALDSRPEPRGPLLVAEREGELVAALALEDGTLVADPFRPTADVVALLRLGAARQAVELRARERRARHRAHPLARLGIGARFRGRARVA